jgi:peptide/nickel transport system substrate-binding protein
MLGKKYLRLVGLSLVLVFMLSLGFGAAQAQDTGSTLIIGWEQEPDLPEIISGSAFSEYLDEFYARDVWDWDTAREIYPIMVEEIPTLENGLVTTTEVMWDDDGNPDTADVAGEAPVVTYKLRPNMHYSDGSSVGSEDCLAMHNLYMQPDAVDSFQRGNYPDVVASAEAVDELTVVLTYNKPWPDFLVDSTLTCAYPSEIFADLDADGDGVYEGNFDDTAYAKGFQDPSALIGYGPYVFSEFNPGQSAVFTKNPLWGENDFETVPAFDTIITQFILESEQMENALEVGDIDLAFNFDGVNNGYGEMANVGIFSTIGVYVDGVWLNSGPFAHPAVQDVRVREAIYKALDRRGIADQFANAGDSLPTSWYPTQFTSPNIEFIEFDQEGARALLTEAGWVDDDADESADNSAPTARVSQGATLPDGTAVADGEKLILRFYTTPVIPRPDIQTVMQAQLAQVGIVTQTFVVNGPTVLFAPRNDRGVLYTGEYDIAMYALSNLPLSMGGSPDNFQCSGIPSAENPEGRNNMWFCNPEYDRLDDQANATIDPEARLELTHQATELMAANVSWGGIRPRDQWYAVRTDRLDQASMEQMGTLSGNYFNRVEFWQPVS